MYRRRFIGTSYLSSTFPLCFIPPLTLLWQPGVLVRTTSPPENTQIIALSVPRARLRVCCFHDTPYPRRQGPVAPCGCFDAVLSLLWHHLIPTTAQPIHAFSRPSKLKFYISPPFYHCREPNRLIAQCSPSQSKHASPAPPPAAEKSKSDISTPFCCPHDPTRTHNQSTLSRIPRRPKS